MRQRRAFQCLPPARAKFFNPGTGHAAAEAPAMSVGSVRVTYPKHLAFPAMPFGKGMPVAKTPYVHFEVVMSRNGRGGDDMSASTGNSACAGSRKHTPN